ncbi:hypothetical protein SUGI_0731680 [Cryptomeria japonica]|nr:hypothetical protein SUGI_0731680 [Cryptomeria japonica]
MRCGLRRLVYLSGSSTNLIDASESIKSTDFSTEKLDGRDIQRAKNLTDTIRKYTYPMLSITTGRMKRKTKRIMVDLSPNSGSKNHDSDLRVPNLAY